MKQKVFNNLYFKILSCLMIIIILFILGLVFYFNFIIEQKIPILTYHNIVSDELYNKYKNDPFLTKESTLRKQLKYLNDHHFRTLSLDEYYCWKTGKCKLPRKSVLITFDDGWSSVYKYALPILKEYNQKAVSFVLYYHVVNHKQFNDINHPYSYLTLDMIKNSISEYSNLEYSSHSYGMHNKEEHKNRPNSVIEKDIKEVKKYNQTKYYAYPNGYFNDDYIRILKENGYQLAFRFGPYANSSRNDDNYKVNRLAAGEILPYWKFVMKMNFRY